MIRHCVVRSYSNRYTSPTACLSEKLSNGWLVKLATPFIKNGDTEYVEYVLEKETELT